MKTYLQTLKVFLYFSMVGGCCLGLGLAIYSGEIFKGFLLGLLGGVLASIVVSLHCFLILVMFNKKRFMYGNMTTQIEKFNIKKVIMEGVAGNATGVRIKYGGLFLTDTSLIFIPHKFAIRPLVIEIPLREINEVKVAGINLLKHFSGGLRKRLFVEKISGEQYEFSIWNIKEWVDKINESIRNEARVSE